MSISMSGHYPANPQQGLYARTIHFAKQYVKPSIIDWIEPQLISAAISTTGIACALTAKNFNSSKFQLLTYTELFLLAIGIIGCVAASTLTYNKYIKYPFINQEIQTSIESSKNNDRSMLILHTTIDWNGSLKLHKTLADYQTLAKKYSIDVLEANSKSQLKTTMALNYKQYDRIDIQAHSNEEEIQLASQVLITKNSKRTLEWINDHIKDDGVIGLVCCSAGKGKKNIARDISRACPNATVYAAADDIHAVTGIEYEEDAIPSFNNGMYCKGKDITRIYRNGVSIR